MTEVYKHDEPMKKWKKKGTLFALTIIVGVLIASLGNSGWEILGGIIIGTGLALMLWDVMMGKWEIFKLD